MCFQFGVNCPECGTKSAPNRNINVSVGSNRVVLLPFHDPVVNNSGTVPLCSVISAKSDFELTNKSVTLRLNADNVRMSQWVLYVLAISELTRANTMNS